MDMYNKYQWALMKQIINNKLVVIKQHNEKQELG
jgi:hypothetical protein